MTKHGPTSTNNILDLPSPVTRPQNRHKTISKPYQPSHHQPTQPIRQTKPSWSHWRSLTGGGGASEDPDGQLGEWAQSKRWELWTKFLMRIMINIFRENQGQHFWWELRTKVFAENRGKKLFSGIVGRKFVTLDWKGREIQTISHYLLKHSIFKNWQNRDNVQICSSLAWALGTCNKIWKIILEPL